MPTRVGLHSNYYFLFIFPLSSFLSFFPAESSLENGNWGEKVGDPNRFWSIFFSLPHKPTIKSDRPEHSSGTVLFQITS